MILPLIELCLVVGAWRAGWKWNALLPVGGVYFVIFCAGYSIGSAGGDTRDYEQYLIIADIVLVGTLVVMMKVKDGY